MIQLISNNLTPPFCSLALRDSQYPPGLASLNFP